MYQYTTEEIIKGIAERKDRIIDYIYTFYYEDIRKMIMVNRGSREDARDIFQEALFVIYQKIILDGLTLKCHFKTYLYSVCRLLWLNVLRKRIHSTGTADGLADLNPSQFTIGTTAEAGQQIFTKHFDEMSKNCRKILDLYFKNVSLDDVCIIMGYKNIQITKDKYYRCKKTLYTRIYNDPEFKKLKDEIYLVG
jgi:RNA polymerase sigma factor (sigma-70 family)